MAIYLIVVNSISFIFTGIDKYFAIKRKMRIDEKTLFLLSFLGGFLGSIVAMCLFHHKTKKIKFYLVNFISALIWILLIIHG